MISFNFTLINIRLYLYAINPSPSKAITKPATRTFVRFSTKRLVIATLLNIEPDEIDITLFKPENVRLFIEVD